MSVTGLLVRGVERLRADGTKGFTDLLKAKYFSPLWDNVIRARRSKTYVIGSTFKFSVPVFDGAEVAPILEDLKALRAASGGAGDVEAVVAVSGDVNVEKLKDAQIPLRIIRVETPRLVLSVVLWTGNVYMPSYLNEGQVRDLEETLSRLGVVATKSRGVLIDRYRNRPVVELEGVGLQTRFLVSSLRSRIDGPHYGFREQIDYEIVKELPRKFQYFKEHCEINYIPLRDLNKYPGRVSRQYVVGSLYKDPYFCTRSVLDVGCDIRGVSEHVGPDTQYVGVDIQGLGDYHLDLDTQALPFPEMSFETVLCFEVLEHLNKIHQSFDDMLRVAARYFVGSLFVESGVWQGKSVNRYGEPMGNMHLPIAPIFDRHEWIFSVTDALDFIYYRSRRAGFQVRRLDIFYDDARPKPFQLPRLRRAFHRGDVRYLAREVCMVGFVVERTA